MIKNNSKKSQFDFSDIEQFEDFKDFEDVGNDVKFVSPQHFVDCAKG